MPRRAAPPSSRRTPWDGTKRKTSSGNYTGLASTFTRLGFREVARRVPHRPIVRFDLARR